MYLSQPNQIRQPVEVSYTKAVKTQNHLVIRARTEDKGKGESDT